MFLCVGALAFGTHHLITMRRSEKRRERFATESFALQMQRVGLAAKWHIPHDAPTARLSGVGASAGRTSLQRSLEL